MAENSGDLSLGYMMGQAEGNSGGGFGGMFGEGLWAIIILAMLGFGGGGFGGYGGQALTRAELYDGFAIQNINNAVNTGFHSVDSALCDIRHQISESSCSLGNTVQSATRDIIENQNANYRGLMDFLVSEKLAAKDARIAEMSTQISQLNQNAVIGARIDAGIAEVIRRTGHDYPSAAYLVQPPTPVNFPTNSCGQVQFGGYGGYGGGCGCGCG